MIDSVGDYPDGDNAGLPLLFREFDTSKSRLQPSVHCTLGSFLTLRFDENGPRAKNFSAYLVPCSRSGPNIAHRENTDGVREA